MSLVDLLLGAGDPEATALHGRRGATTYRDLADQVARLTADVLSKGIQPGDRVAIASANDECFVVAYLAALRAGAIAVPLNPMAPPAELERGMGAVDPAVTLAAGPSVSLLGAAAAKRVLRIDLDELPSDAAPPVARADDDVAVLLFTSGTAGEPKAAMLTHGNLSANIREVLDHPGLRLNPDDVGLGALPFFHVFGLNAVLGVGLASGASVVLVDHFDPAATARVIKERGVTMVAGVPAMFAGWLGTPEVAADTFSGVRLAVSGAAPLPDEIALGFLERFGVILHQGYGLTEASPIVTTTALMTTPHRPGSIGPPLPGVEVRLVDDDGQEALAGDPGELQVRGPSVFAGYWKDEEATARALDGGWLHTGDVAVVDDDGGLRLVDRAKDLIIVSGFNVFPVEVEEVLRTHPDVLDAAAVGEPHVRTGETVAAYVVPKPGTTPDEVALGQHCAHHLARYKCPSRVEIVDHLPRAPSGKLLRRELRD